MKLSNLIIAFFVEEETKLWFSEWRTIFIFLPWTRLFTEIKKLNINHINSVIFCYDTSVCRTLKFCCIDDNWIFFTRKTAINESVYRIAGTAPHMSCTNGYNPIWLLMSSHSICCTLETFKTVTESVTQTNEKSKKVINDMKCCIASSLSIPSYAYAC